MSNTSVTFVAVLVFLFVEVSASPISRASPFKSGGFSMRSIDDCYITDDECACSEVTPVGNKCYDATGVDTATGLLTCEARACQTSHACDCAGSKLCKREEATRMAIRIIDGTSFCSKQEVTEMKATVLEGQNVPVVDLKGEKLVAFNETHCSCSTKASMYASVSCLDYFSALNGDQMVCTSRQCNIKPTDMVCDFNGEALCQRDKVMSMVYVGEGIMPGTTGKVICRSKNVEQEVATCISSCQNLV